MQLQIIPTTDKKKGFFMAWKRQYFHLLGLEGQLIGNAARAGVVVHFASTGEVVCVFWKSAFAPSMKRRSLSLFHGLSPFCLHSLSQNSKSSFPLSFQGYYGSYHRRLAYIIIKSLYCKNPAGAGEVALLWHGLIAEWWITVCQKSSSRETRSCQLHCLFAQRVGHTLFVLLALLEEKAL